MPERMSTSNTERAAMPEIRVWDAPVRLFHWLLVACFAGAWYTAESESLRELHLTFGLTMAGLVALRIVWGLIGTPHARFAQFVRSPSAVLAYLKSLRERHPEHHAGHNPAGGWAILMLLTLIGVTAASGWFTYSDLGDAWEELHEAGANLLMGIVVVHVLAVLVSSKVHGENLVRAMFTGRKRGEAAEDNGPARRAVAAVLLVAVLVVWIVQWPQITQGPPMAGAHHAHDDDDD
jgi:cytochrome b